MAKKPIDMRNALLAQKMIKNLEQRHFEAYYCPTHEEAVAQALQLMPAGSSVSWGGSMSIRDSGLVQAVKSGDYVVYDREEAKNEAEKLAIYRKAFECDFYLSSVNAISQDGVVVNIDGNGNRVAAITWGPERVIFLVGMNKVCQDVDSALARAWGTAAPVNAARFDIQTPCHADGCCHQCHSPQSICNYIHFLRNSHPVRRHIIILVGENLGY
ncbi:MAG: lactate utilization protein [Prevotella sp.]|jgi:hypothetical protein|nr:lactate utilization protein [Prevotella sp.]